MRFCAMNSKGNQMESPSPLLPSQPHVIASLDAAFDAYEDALLRNDVAMLDEFFWYDDNTVRYGVAENLYGGQQIREYRMRCAAVHQN
jgi:hypothetical protein